MPAMDSVKSGSVCRVVDALFVPIENKLGAKPAETACCCCKLPLRTGVLAMGGGTVAFLFLNIVLEVLALLAPANLRFLRMARLERVLTPVFLPTALIWAYGVRRTCSSWAAIKKP
jgi:hypothetical protein